MQTRTVEISVGLFILVGVLAMAFLAIQISGLNHSFNSDETYRLYAEFNNIEGVTRKAKVSMAGVQVGQVTNIAIDPKSMRARVDMIISKDVDYLSEDTIAAVHTAGILGEKYIALSPGGAEEILTDGDQIRDTQSALILEELVGKMLTSKLNSP